MPRPILWQAVLLLPQPILTLLYLLAVRTGRAEPSFTPVVAAAILPLLSALVGAAKLRHPEPAASRGAQIALLAAAALEVSFTVLAAAVIGFAIGPGSL